MKPPMPLTPAMVVMTPAVIRRRRSRLRSAITMEPSPKAATGPSSRYRRRILNQLNRGEGRHSVARTICYGQRGEIRKRYREGQEDQLGALGLVTNAVVLWNTMYMQAALDYLQEQSMNIREEDEARLSPLVHGHFNVLGHYSFTLTEQIMKGQLRPLNQASGDMYAPYLPADSIVTMPEP
jgi:hypothetical protein